MKNIEIYIKEINRKEDCTPIEEKLFMVTKLYDENFFEMYLSDILDTEWRDIKEYFLKNRAIVPFEKIRRNHEKD